MADDAERARIFCVTAGDASVGSAWVPAVARTTLTDDAEVTVAVTAGDLTGETPFDTTDEGPTCITTLQLA